MINLLNEKLKHPYFNTEWTVIGYENGKLECVSDKSSVTEWITREYGLELYAEEQKRRADELEIQVETYKEYVKNVIVKYEEYKALQKRADELEHLIENYLFSNRESDVYAIKSEEELREEYEKLKSR